MKGSVKFFTKLIAFLFVVVVAIPSYAQPKGNPPGPKGGPGAGSIREKAVVNKPWEAKADVNNDGMIDRVEIDQWKESHPRRQKNNPPGGPGAGLGYKNGNPPGPKGGPGSGPRYKKGNPPGPKGGSGKGRRGPKK